jgi:hypothetical protein
MLLRTNRVRTLPGRTGSDFRISRLPRLLGSLPNIWEAFPNHFGSLSRTFLAASRAFWKPPEHLGSPPRLLAHLTPPSPYLAPQSPQTPLLGNMERRLSAYLPEFQTCTLNVKRPIHVCHSAKGFPKHGHLHRIGYIVIFNNRTCASLGMRHPRTRNVKRTKTWLIRLHKVLWHGA